MLTSTFSCSPKDSRHARVLRELVGGGPNEDLARQDTPRRFVLFLVASPVGYLLLLTFFLSFPLLSGNSYPEACTEAFRAIKKAGFDHLNAPSDLLALVPRSPPEVERLSALFDAPETPPSDALSLKLAILALLGTSSLPPRSSPTKTFDTKLIRPSFLCYLSFQPTSAPPSTFHNHPRFELPPSDSPSLFWLPPQLPFVRIQPPT